MEKKKTFDVKSLLKISSNNKKLLGMLILVIIVLSIATGGSFAKIGQFQLIAYLFPEMGVLALGMMLAMVSGGIDLTVIAVADLAGILSCLLMKAIMPADASMPVQILVLLVTLAFALLIYAGLDGVEQGLTPPEAVDVNLYTADASVTDSLPRLPGPSILYKVVNFELFGLIPGTTIVFIICAALVAFLLNKTATGFKIYMIGSNATASEYSGSDNKKILTLTYMISGMLSAVSGLLMCGHFNSARSDFGKSYLTPAILICVLAGVNPNGGVGKVSGIVLAVIILQSLSSGFAMFPSISDYYKNLIWGLVLIGIMIINVVTATRKKKS